MWWRCDRGRGGLTSTRYVRVGIVLSVTLAICAVVTQVVGVRLRCHRVRLALHRGAMEMTHMAGVQKEPLFITACWPLYFDYMWLPRLNVRGWQYFKSGKWSRCDIEASLPCWMPAMAVALVTGCLWLRRRSPPNACHRCAYDLTNNVSGICPECGEPIRHLQGRDTDAESP